VILAGQWYASAAFVDTLALVLVALVAMVVGARVAISTGFPKRRLVCGMPVIAPLLSAPSGVRGDLELLRRGKPLSDPHLLEVHLTSRSRRDIPSEDFDSHQPLLIDVGAPIVEILRITSTPISPPAPDVAYDGTALKIGPSLIGKRQKITITVLADGPDPRLTYMARLINVDVREQKPEDPAVTILSLQLVREQSVVIVGVAAGLAALAVAAASKGALTLTASWIALFMLGTAAIAQSWMIVTVVRSPVRHLRRKASPDS